jgi:hypothetical protein
MFYRHCVARNIKIVAVLVLSHAISIRSFSQGRIWFSELSYNNIPQQNIQYSDMVDKRTAFGFSANINNGGRRTALLLQVDYSGVRDINAAPMRSLQLWELYLGMRYYPMIPTIRFGTKVAIRFTAGGLIGGYQFYWHENDAYDNNTLKWSAAQFCPTLFAGLCFSPFRSTTGLSVKLNYKPQTYSMPASYGLSLKQPFSISAGLFIGSRIRT